MLAQFRTQRVFLGFLLTFSISTAQALVVENNTPQYKVVLRMTAHELLYQFGDSSSVVLPIQLLNQRYKIQFANAFAFEPARLTRTIDSVFKVSGIEKHYRVEVEDCENHVVVYSYEVGMLPGDSSGIRPCQGREYPLGCYEVFVTFEKAKAGDAASMKTGERLEKSDEGSFPTWLFGAMAAVLFAFVLYGLIGRTKKPQNMPPHIFSIGAYKFDKRNMQLTFKDITIELTSKEADLLFLLRSSANETIERDVILRVVWGDDGDYVGRTLDVFISKLRKKLADDPRVKIANIRGVGYRLVVDATPIS